MCSNVLVKVIWYNEVGVGWKGIRFATVTNGLLTTELVVWKLHKSLKILSQLIIVSPTTQNKLDFSQAQLL